MPFLACAKGSRGVPEQWSTLGREFVNGIARRTEFGKAQVLLRQNRRCKRRKPTSSTWTGKQTSAKQQQSSLTRTPRFLLQREPCGPEDGARIRSGTGLDNTGVGARNISLELMPRPHDISLLSVFIRRAPSNRWTFGWRLQKCDRCLHITRRCEARCPSHRILGRHPCTGIHQVSP